MNNADTDILWSVRAQFRAAPPARLGVAVSGGGDSVALLHILHRCFADNPVELFAATVNHGLRSEAAEEARAVADLAASLGISHETLEWTGWDGAGNLQARAREARYELLGEWARARQITVLATGHTADDQAETVLMRLSRAAGVDGLAAMPTRRTMHGVTVVRPTLRLTRAELRDYLVRQGLNWSEDPSNEDTTFERVRMRRALEHLEPLGITTKALAEIAGHMGEAREALDWYTFLSARDFAQVDEGDVVICRRRFRTLPEEIARRLLNRSVMWISRNPYPPRRTAVAEMIDAIRGGRSATLSGCRVLHQGKQIRICREHDAVRDLRTSAADLWDGRWRLHGNEPHEYEIRALGLEGLEGVGNWRETGRPHASLMATPSVWSGDELVAAPIAGHANGWHAELVEGGESFFAALLSH